MKTIEKDSRKEFADIFIPKDKKQITKHFIKCMSDELGNMNDTIVKVSADCYQKELALAGKMKVHLVTAFNLLVQLEQAIEEPEGTCKLNKHKKIDWQAIRKGNYRPEYPGVDLNDPKLYSGKAYDEAMKS